MALVAELYTLSKTNQDFLNARFLSDDIALIRYKAKIKKHLAPDEPWKNSQQISLKEAKKALSDYKKASSDKIGLVDLMVYYVECGTDFIYEFGDMYEQYYMSLESVFETAFKLIKEFNLEEREPFVHRLRIVINKANHMGWGYYDILSEMFSKL